MKSLLTIAVLLYASMVGVTQAQDEVAWFDMGNCEICQNMAGIEGMMQQIKWEIHSIENGCLSVTVLPDELKDDWATAMKNVETTVAKIENGEATKLCGFCQSMGGLMQAGAKKKTLETVAGHIEIITSDDPAVVEKIHAHVKRTLEETKKMAEMMLEHSHDGEHGDDDHEHEHDGDDDHEHDDDVK